MFLMQSNSFKKNDPWYKTEVVRRLESGKESVSDVAAQIGIHAHTLYRWIGEYKSGKLDKKKNAVMASKYPQVSVTHDKKAAPTSLEKEVEMLRLKVHAYETMIEIAESELGISIKKKSFAKPSTSSVASTPSLEQPSVSIGSADGLATADKPTTNGKQAPKSGKKGRGSC
jgi:transposase-like protein